MKVTLDIKDIENNEKTCGSMTTGIEYNYHKVGKGSVLTTDQNESRID